MSTGKEYLLRFGRDLEKFVNNCGGLVRGKGPDQGKLLVKIVNELELNPDEPLMKQNASASYKPRQFSKGSIGTSDERICVEVRSLNLDPDKPLLGE